MPRKTTEAAATTEPRVAKRTVTRRKKTTEETIVLNWEHVAGACVLHPSRCGRRPDRELASRRARARGRVTRRTMSGGRGRPASASGFAPCEMHGRRNRGGRERQEDCDPREPCHVDAPPLVWQCCEVVIVPSAAEDDVTEVQISPDDTLPAPNNSNVIGSASPPGRRASRSACRGSARPDSQSSTTPAMPAGDEEGAADEQQHDRRRLQRATPVPRHCAGGCRAPR